MPKLPVLLRARAAVARWIAPAMPRRGQRLYSSARSSRVTVGFGGSDSSADNELAGSLTTLRARSRQMVRDAAYAKRAKSIVQNNVVGSGVGLQAQVYSTRNDLHRQVNAAIESAWQEWSDAASCHTGGALAFGDLERALIGQVFEAGEVFVRLHRRPFGRSRVPLALELIEAERVSSDLLEPTQRAPGTEVRLGVEVDGFGRAVAYWIRTRHPGDLRLRMDTATDAYERVPAEDIMHLRLVDRWPQVRGEPWMHTALRKLDALSEYSQYEVDAARASAAYFGTIETPEDGPTSLETDKDASDRPLMEVETLTFQQLAPGEKLTWHAPNRPNAALDPFMRAMLREMAAGIGVSYESLSRDYSQSNYSSSRLALLDDRDLWRVLQQWWIRSFRLPLHRVWLQQAVLARAVGGIDIQAYAADPARYEAVRFKPRGWSWVDPTKEVAAYKEAIKAGLTTLTDVIAQTADGRDIEDVIETRRRELDMLDEADIDVDTTVPEGQEPAAPMGAQQGTGQAAQGADDDTEQDDVDPASDGGAGSARLVQLRRTA